jgi:hypothetical protein
MTLNSKNCTERCIGDAVRFNGELYTITGNYPRHGYLLMRPKRVSTERAPQSVRLPYRNLSVA